MKSRYMPVIVALLLCVSGCGQLANEQPAPASTALPAETAAPAAVEPVTEASPAEPISSGYIISGADEYVSLYQQPDSSSTALARLYTGDFIAIYALQGQWYQVKLGDISGYISVDNVSFSKPDAAAPETNAIKAESPEPVQTAAQPVQTAAQTAAQQPVNVTINLQYDVYGIALPKSYPTYIAYDSVRNAYCSAESCYIYKTASTSGPKRNADMLYKGDAVTVYGEYGGFYYIGTDSGSGSDLMGYVQTQYITIGTPPPAEDKSYSATEGYVDVKSCKVRSSPSKETDNNVIDTIYEGQYFTINSFDGYWYYINYNGKSGYVSYKMVSVY